MSIKSKLGLGALLATVLQACTGTPPTDIGIQEDGKLLKCPDSPNCVSSGSPSDDLQHYIAPLMLRSADQWQNLLDMVKTQPRTELVESTETYAYFRSTTLMMRYVDDVEFLRASPESIEVAVRSASRLGKSDFGVNRERIEEYRKQLSNARIVE